MKKLALVFAITLLNGIVFAERNKTSDVQENIVGKVFRVTAWQEVVVENALGIGQGEAYLPHNSTCFLSPRGTLTGLQGTITAAQVQYKQTRSRIKGGCPTGTITTTSLVGLNLSGNAQQAQGTADLELAEQMRMAEVYFAKTREGINDDFTEKRLDVEREADKHFLSPSHGEEKPDYICYAVSNRIDQLENLMTEELEALEKLDKQRQQRIDELRAGK